MAFGGVFSGVWRPPFGGGAAAALPCYYLTFDGSDWLTLAGIVIPPPFTIVAWTKRRVVTLNQVIIGNFGALPTFYASNANRTRWNKAGGGSVVSTADPSTAWMHRAIVVPDGANGSTYKDGVDDTSTTVITAGNQTFATIGRYTAVTQLWDGQLAAIGIAPAALNIPALWAAGTLHKPLDPATFTTACWNGRTEGGAGATLDDESASGNDGTFGAAGAAPTWGGLMSAGGPAGWSDG